MSYPKWTRDRWLDLIFLIGIGLKGLDGAAELLIGLPLLFLRPAQIFDLTQLVTAGELREDPHDFIAHILLHGADSLSGEATTIAAVYLIIHGIVKLGILAALFRGTRRIYPLAIAALAGFLAWQVVQLATSPSVGIAALTVFDVIVLALTWREWRHHNRSLRDAWHSVARRPAAAGRAANSRRTRSERGRPPLPR